MRRWISDLLGKIRARLPIRGAFGQNVFQLFAANAAAQLLTFAAYPILTRLYSPAQLGILSAVMFAMMILTALSTLRYEIALPMCRSNVEAGSVIALCFAVILMSCGLMAGVLLAPPQWLIHALGPSAPYRQFIPLSLLVFGTYNVVAYDATRVGRYDELAKTRISQALLGPASQITLGLVYGSTVGLLSGFTIGLMGGTLRLSRKVIFTTPSIFTGVSMRSIIDVAKRYRRFPLYSSWAGVLLAASTSLGNIVFTTLYGATIGGYLFLADRVLLQPLRVSGNAFQQVFVGEGGRMAARNPAEFLALFVGVLWKQAAISAAWLGGVYLCDTLALPFIFGHSWGPAAEYVKVMLVGYFPTAAAIPMSHTLNLMGRQRLSAALDVLRFAALLASIEAARHFGVTALNAVLWYSVTQGVAQCLILGVMYARIRSLISSQSVPAAPV